MIAWLKEHFHASMTRAFIYKVFSRGILTLFAAQLVHFFAPASWPLTRFNNLAAALGVQFVLFAVLAWLRYDGLKIPHAKLPRMKRKDPPFLTNDIADHLDDDVILFDDLDKEEQDVCVLLADVILAVICFALAAILK